MTARTPPTLSSSPHTEKSSGQVPNEQEASPKVGGLVETPSISRLARSKHTSTLANRSHGDEDSGCCEAIHSQRWALWKCVLPSVSRSGCLSPHPPLASLLHSLWLFAASQSFSLTPVWGLSVSVFPKPAVLSNSCCGCRQSVCCGVGYSLPPPIHSQTYPHLSLSLLSSSPTEAEWGFCSSPELN